MKTRREKGNWQSLVTTSGMDGDSDGYVDIKEFLKNDPRVPEIIVELFFGSEDLPEDIVNKFHQWLLEKRHMDRKWEAIERMFHRLVETGDEETMDPVVKRKKKVTPA